jgi:hypothetical protein
MGVVSVKAPQQQCITAIGAAGRNSADRTAGLGPGRILPILLLGGVVKDREMLLAVTGTESGEEIPKGIRLPSILDCCSGSVGVCKMPGPREKAVIREDSG